MTTKQELTAKIAELQAQVDAMPEPETQPEIGRVALDSDEAEFVLYGNGDIGTHSGEKHINQGVAFTTREAAEYQKWINEHRQLARVAMDIDWGGVVCDWKEGVQRKHIINNGGDLGWVYVRWYFLSFRTEEARDDFAAKYTKEQLIMLARGE